MGDDGDLIPTRDYNHRKSYGEDVSIKSDQQRRMVSKWVREDLEDKYLRLYEENLVLKKHARKQEDKIKRMATKLLRLVNDKKKTEGGQTVSTGVGKKGRDIETEEKMEELQSKVRELEKLNHNYKEKLMVAKQQLATTTTKRNTQYGHVQSRIFTGIQKPPQTDPRVAKNIRVMGPAPPAAMSGRNSYRDTGTGGAHPAPNRYGHSLLEEARADNKQLEEVIEQLNEQIAINEQDIEMFKEQMRVREAEYEEDLLKIKQQMTQGQRAAVQENIDIIRLQREVKEKSTKLTALQGQYQDLEDKLRTVRQSHDQVLGEMERLNQQLKGEQNKVMTLQNELKSGSGHERRIHELQERVVDMEKECEILREANEKLVSSAFDLEREREWRQKENALKVQIAQLEATLKADVGEKGSILDRLNAERDNHEKLEEDHKKLRIDYFSLREEHEDLKDKMKFFTKESAVDFQEIEEALMIVKSRKQKEDQELDFLGKVDDEKNKDYEKLVRELQADHADTINELEKTRNMLIVQHKINKDYQAEVTAVTHKMDENKTEYEAKLDEYAYLLDLRATRIKKLESQLRDIAYGTKQFRIKAGEEDEGSDTESLDETIHLERGQNMFEIHIKRIVFSAEGLRQLADEEPSVFCTYEFYEHETQATPVRKGPKPDFEFTSQYLVKVDDFFLHYLQRDACTVELHQSMGTDFVTVAACQLKLKDILNKNSGRHHGQAQLVGIENGGVGVNYGTVEYWVRLRVPMAQALRLYKERSKALGYIDTNQRAAEQALEALDENAAKRPLDNVNELTIKVLKCQGVQARRDGTQPSPYLVYTFFDFDDHDTTIVTGSNDPQFNDHKSYPVPMTADLDKYLKSQPLYMYVFDDTDPDDTSYLGVAKIPLIQLAHDKAIKGIFELHTKEGTVNGTAEVSLKWRYTYIPPKAATRTPAQQQLLDSIAAEAPSKIPMLPGEEEQLQESRVVAGAPDTFPTTPQPRPPKPRGPSASSTPMVNRTPAERESHPPDSELQPIPLPELSVTPPTPKQRKPPSLHNTISSEMVATQESIAEEPELEATHEAMETTQEDRESIVSEGSHVTGESEPVSVSEASTPRDEGPMPVSKQSSELDEVEQSVDDLIAEEMGEKPKLDAVRSSEDTMFGDDPSGEQEGEEVDEEIEEEEEESEEDAEGDSDSEGVVMAPSPAPRPGSGAGLKSDLVTVTISHLSLNAGSRMMENPDIKMLFVEYRFLGVPLEETETPFSLPKPTPDNQITYNFTKVFHVDFEKNYERRQFLASMLLPEDPDQGRIRMTVVSEPPEDVDDGDCEDVGVAFISIRDILDTGKDVIDKDIPIYDIEDESTEIGSINVTVECLAALMAVQQELADD